MNKEKYFTEGLALIKEEGEKKTLMTYAAVDETVTVPDGITVIGNAAFAMQEHVKEIILPDSVTEIESLAFSYCTSLEHIILPERLKKIGKDAFFCCLSLKELHIPDSVGAKGKRNAMKIFNASKKKLKNES